MGYGRTDRQTDGPTGRRTNGRIDKASYRDACQSSYRSARTHFAIILTILDDTKKMGYGRTDGPTDRRTDGPTDGRTDRRTEPLIEMRGRI